MKLFICKACGETSYSSADPKYQTNPNCPYCGAEADDETDNK